ncbi:nicotinate-nucleotide adenylyltransferase [Hasllibacter halocynthiae]|uniref:Probable nicotinate-nucleotide adenylyltransferase n=1 Tax=Hasllibacter halocynthiae TaxID=595589 RepID=A0A2T0X495_9RHOB|nr:nicotinate-nucleotide adenylyltransferase [Hasllibacter halocynthiae]PRY93759.1 nicotinate-nucleotide adenylyltransferase [Hasllibacter halocynthiae]
MSAAARRALPPAPRGGAVGVLGGSFDPAHEGHLAITREAMARIGLSRAWWLVSPGNPLKPDAPAALERRLARARAVATDPRIAVTGIEAALGTRYTAETLAALRALRPDLRLVWLMGADNLVQFHRWRDWRGIAAHHPIGVLARPGLRVAARTAPAAQAMERARVRAPGLLLRRGPPAWCLVNIPMRGESSTAIRARGGWRR